MDRKRSTPGRAAPNQRTRPRIEVLVEEASAGDLLSPHLRSWFGISRDMRIRVHRGRLELFKELRTHLRYGIIPRKYANNPDRVAGKPSVELGRILNKAGVTKESKRIWAQRIGPRLEPDRNASPSFRAFLTGVRDLVDRQ